MAGCKYCGAVIEWGQVDGRWQPFDPKTRERHDCKIEIRCASCEETFVGKPWQKKCPKCYRAELPPPKFFRLLGEPGTDPRAQEVAEALGYERKGGRDVVRIRFADGETMTVSPWMLVPATRPGKAKPEKPQGRLDLGRPNIPDIDDDVPF